MLLEFINFTNLALKLGPGLCARKMFFGPVSYHADCRETGPWIVT